MAGIVIDSRQQKGKHEAKHKYFDDMGVATIRCALPVGDYVLVPAVSVDTKASIYELAQDIDQEHERFRNEQIRAKELGSKLVILVENEDGVTDLESLTEWREERRHFKMRKARSGNMYARQIEGERLAKACATMSRKYGTVFDFCHPDEAGERVMRWLGEFDGTASI